MHNISLGDLSMKFTTSYLIEDVLFVCMRERERILMGVFLKFCVGLNLPIVPEEGLLAYTKLCSCF